MNDYIYGMISSNDYLMHYRTKGSKNGISRTKGYVAIGKKAMDRSQINTLATKGAKNSWQMKGEAARAIDEAAYKKSTGISRDFFFDDPRHKRTQRAKIATGAYDTLGVDKYNSPRIYSDFSYQKAAQKHYDANKPKVYDSKWLNAYKKYAVDEDTRPEKDKQYAEKLKDEAKKRYVEYHGGNDDATARSAMKNDPRYNASSVKLDTKTAATNYNRLGRTDNVNRRLTNDQEIAKKIAKRKHWYNIINHPLDAIKDKTKKLGKSLISKFKKWFS